MRPARVALTQSNAAAAAGHEGRTGTMTPAQSLVARGSESLSRLRAQERSEV